MNLEEITLLCRQATEELINIAKLSPGDLLVVGCSSSEVLGERIGTNSSTDVAGAILEGILPVCREHEIFLAAQCCEHLNRALILERQAALARGLELVNVVPQPKAGGSFATAFYNACQKPAAVEHIRAQAGMDIGDTLIGMHLADVAVPVRLSMRRIGQANLVCARTRPKFIGGQRAHYDQQLL
ncbi:TIGR01440 family protein [Angelakisella massiliensis]|uniref:TIGR01440 family protein n=1 Tax=Angelakisella massiliensis TaxID=1871018 RepID=UPI0008F94C40|nr:TIGR01440 family protein [Angelakisella massiliensis]